MSSRFHPPALTLPDNTGSTIALFGSSKSGKTTIMQWLYQKYFRYSHICVLCVDQPQIAGYEIFKDGHAVITNEFCDCMQLLNLARDIQLNTKNAYKFAFFIDDIIDQKNSTLLRKMILTMRNSNISTIISLQYQTLLDKSSRTSLNHAFFSKYNSLEGKRDAIEKFLATDLAGGDIGTRLNKKIERYEALTQDYNFIYKNMLDEESFIGRLRQKDVPWLRL